LHEKTDFSALSLSEVILLALGKDQKN